MAFTDSADDNPEGMEGPGSSDTGSPAGVGPEQPGMPPAPQGGPILAALQRRSLAPQVSAPGPGNMADALGKLKIAVDMMQAALQGFDPGSQQHKDTLRSLTVLTRHLPQTGNQQGLEQTHLMDLLRRGRQNPVLQALAGLIGGGGGGRPQGSQPPMPSLPLPGA